MVSSSALILALLSGPPAPAGVNADSDATRFLGTVLSVEAIGARELSLLPADLDPRYAVVVSVDGYPESRDSGPFHRGAAVGFAIHSPSKLFRRAPPEIVGRQFLFDFPGRLAVIAPGAQRKLGVKLEEAASLDWIAGDAIYRRRSSRAVIPAMSDSVDGWRSVVVVVGRFPAPREDIFGNGVLLEGAPHGKAWVLTCAHLVDHAVGAAREVRVGLFDHSLLKTPPGAPRYMETFARVLSLDATTDLSLLEFDCPLALHVARTLNDEELKVWQPTYCGRDAVSIVPHGRPTAVSGAPTKLSPGQSGTPAFSDGKVVWIAQAIRPEWCSQSGGIWAGPEKIRAFLRVPPRQSR